MQICHHLHFRWENQANAGNANTRSHNKTTPARGSKATIYPTNRTVTETKSAPQFNVSTSIIYNTSLPAFTSSPTSLVLDDLPRKRLTLKFQKVG